MFSFLMPISEFDINVIELKKLFSRVKFNIVKFSFF